MSFLMYTNLQFSHKTKRLSINIGMTRSQYGHVTKRPDIYEESDKGGRIL